MNSTRSIGGTIPTSLTHWSRYCTYRLFQLQLFLVSFRMGPNPFVPFSTLNGLTYMWLLVDEFNSQYWWNYPHFFETLSRWLYVQAQSSSFYFGISTRMGLTLCSFSACSMGCNVHVTTHWMNSTRSIGGTIPTSLTHWSRYCTYRLFQLQLFWYLSTRMGLSFVPFQRSMGCNVHVTTRGWIQLVWWNPSFWHLSRYCTYRLFQLQLFLVSFN
jgi:hypothetical protein